MQVISSEIGFALKFKNKNDLKNVVDNLQGQLEWINQENIEPPYIYLTYADTINPEIAREYISELKRK